MEETVLESLQLSVAQGQRTRCQLRKGFGMRIICASGQRAYCIAIHALSGSNWRLLIRLRMQEGADSCIIQLGLHKHAISHALRQIRMMLFRLSTLKTLASRDAVASSRQWKLSTYKRTLMWPIYSAAKWAERSSLQLQRGHFPSPQTKIFGH